MERAADVPPGSAGDLTHFREGEFTLLREVTALRHRHTVSNDVNRPVHRKELAVLPSPSLNPYLADLHQRDLLATAQHDRLVAATGATCSAATEASGVKQPPTSLLSLIRSLLLHPRTVTAAVAATALVGSVCFSVSDAAASAAPDDGGAVVASCLLPSSLVLPWYEDTTASDWPALTWPVDLLVSMHAGIGA